MSATADPTPAPTRDADHWTYRLAELTVRHSVPGATLGIWHRGRLIEAAAGLANADERIEATPDTVWQIGSISKVYTTTVAMTLVDEGVLDLDAPVLELLPELRVVSEELTLNLTLRHILTHTSGIDGDVFVDTGRGDDCLERFAALLAEVDAIHPLGATFSYCNAGFSLLGYVLERVTGLPWDELMRRRLYEPLGLTRTATLPEEVLRFRAAAGHLGTPARVAPQWMLMRNAGPAGLICSTARDLLTFARLHLDGGVADEGGRLLSAQSAEAMRTRQVELPDRYTFGDAWGLGWMLEEWDGRWLYGHDGSTIGQDAFLRVLPDEELAVCLLTNGGSSRGLYRDLYREVFAELAGLAMPAPIAPADHPVATDPADIVGVYERTSMRTEVFQRDGELIVRTRFSGELAKLVEKVEQEWVMHPLAPGSYVIDRDGKGSWSALVFYTLPDGSRYLHYGVRTNPKVG
ncbi:serine hydrolase domain-containing protein [Kitasatospora kifunensis]|uniref:CubicO group peptidase (Beta-lactamase class C family) n=1 Tax=Kitasatospora kifunensis TaxID=58351 RepID=A0A7W7QXV9_KITKI|nr:serine hydrolase domain-containing protein [Kitasatospora kifunensis]MBB4921544.1 CubicO group peptidase (beta-lactamase class C family) [Kitasatospora kifunensis]